MKKSLTNLEYINSLPCSQKLKDRIIELTKENYRESNPNFLNDESTNNGIWDLFVWSIDTEKDNDYWNSINEAILHNTPIVE